MDNRVQVIDYFRGIAIIDMMLVHFNNYFPLLAAKVIDYTDIAMEGFILLAGFMVGYHYYPKFLKDGGAVTKRLFHRALKIFAIQCLFILTLNLPLYYILYDKIRQIEPLPVFLTKSVFFLNQIGLIHILPTFIPLLIISPAILYLVKQNYATIVILGSISLFLIGNKYPYALDLGEQTIFPFILWQIYFVAGCLLGIRAYANKAIGPRNIDKYFFMSMLSLLVVMLLKFGKIVSPTLISKFPLNGLGLLYGATMLFMIYTFTLKYWHVLGKIKICSSYVPLLGRYSLLTFVLHVYTTKGITVINHFYRLNNYENYVIIILSMFIIYTIVYFSDRTKKKNYPTLAIGKVHNYYPGN